MTTPRNQTFRRDVLQALRGALGRAEVRNVVPTLRPLLAYFYAQRYADSDDAKRFLVRRYYDALARERARA